MSYICKKSRLRYSVFYSMKHILALIIGLLIPAAAAAQHHERDDNNVSTELPPPASSGMLLNGNATSSPLPGYYYPSVRPDWDRPLWRPSFEFSSNAITVDRAGIAPIAMWGTGGLMAMGARQSLPGLMGHEHGALTFTQMLGPLSLTASATADKYGYYRGLQTVYGLSGTATYTINETFGLTLFGSYYARNPYMGAAMMPYVSSTNFGGFMSVNFSDHFGVDVGAQSTYRPYARGWHTQPIVMPYYRTDSGAKIGIDIGGLLLEVIDNASGRRNKAVNPTIGPPIPTGPPPVPPHR